jgi:hypothetical protein
MAGSAASIPSPETRNGDGLIAPACCAAAVVAATDKASNKLVMQNNRFINTSSVLLSFSARGL